MQSSRKSESKSEIRITVCEQAVTLPLTRNSYRLNFRISTMRGKVASQRASQSDKQLESNWLEIRRTADSERSAGFSFCTTRENGENRCVAAGCGEIRSQTLSAAEQTERSKNTNNRQDRSTGRRQSITPIDHHIVGAVTLKEVLESGEHGACGLGRQNVCGCQAGRVWQIKTLDHYLSHSNAARPTKKKSTGYFRPNVPTNCVLIWRFVLESVSCFCGR